MDASVPYHFMGETSLAPQMYALLLNQEEGTALGPSSGVVVPTGEWYLK